MAENQRPGPLRAPTLSGAGSLAYARRKHRPLTMSDNVGRVVRMTTSGEITTRTLNLCPFYQSILENLQVLNSLVRLDPIEFDRDFLRKIDEEIGDLVDRVSEGTI